MIKSLEDISIHAWIQEHKLKNEKGDRIEFKDHMFLFDPYTDTSPLQVTYKAAQIGYSVMACVKVFYTASKLGLDIIYTMPTDQDVSIFVGGKVNRLIRQNKILQEYTADKDTVEQKKVGDQMIYFRGTFTKRAAISVTADLLVHDEVDFSDQEIIGDYESRLQHSKFAWRWYFGHPSAPGIGVSKYWDKSDQKHWFVKCSHCGEKQYLSWPDSICPERKIYQCKKCKQEIYDDDRRQGEWIRKYKDKEFSGYWIPLMIAPWVTASKILEYYKEKTEEYFYNRVLGLPYVGSGNKVMQDDILGNLTKQINDQSGKIVIGVDTGIYLRFVVGNEQGIFYYGQCKSYGEIEKLMKMFKNSIVVFDQGGDIVGVREMRDKYIGRVFLCHYRQDRKTMQLVTWGKDDEDGNVTVDRNRMIQWVIDEFKDRRIPLYGTEADWWDYWLHWNNIYRTQEEDNLGVMKHKWLRSGRDDWVHATVYWRAGMSRFAHQDGMIFHNTDDNMVQLAPSVGFDGKLDMNPFQSKKINLNWKINA